MKFKSLADKFSSELKTAYAVEEIDAMFMLTMRHFFNWSKVDYVLKKDELVKEDTLSAITAVIARVKKGEPLQYVLGEAHFYGLNFKVDPSVLIPRPETEELVEWIIQEVEKITFEVQQPFNLLDIGTGSGCIAIALKKSLPEVKIDALDISPASLIIAQENALQNNIEIDFIQADILDLQSTAFVSYQVIVSNPPYITETEKAEMHQNVIDNEPNHALFVSDEQPLVFYEAIADFALSHLLPNGMLFFEINGSLGEETVLMLRDKGLKNIKLRKDMQGTDRMIYCQL